MISRRRLLASWFGLFLIGLSGCGPATSPTPAKVDNSRCRITTLSFDSIPQTGDTIRVKAGSKIAMSVEGESVGIYCFPSKRGRLSGSLPGILGSLSGSRPGSKMDGKLKFLEMSLETTIVRAGSGGEDVEEANFLSDVSGDTLVDCDERLFSWNPKIQAPTRKGDYEFRIKGYWIGEPKVDPGTPYTPDSHVLGTWKLIVE